VSLSTAEIRAGTPLAGRYRVLRRLGTGGMATVFLAEDERLGREVAIKRLHTDAPEASLRRFEQEAKLGAALNHPNLVAIYDTVAAEEGALIVMEYVHGKPLSELAGRPMRPSRALPILRSVADALDHAHAEGVVHRDVKPGNVLVGDDGTVKLADLGIARAIGASQITSEGSVVGTLPYMSPERLAGPGAGGPESDVYALAAVAYELLSGRPPSEAASTGEAAARAPVDLSREWPEGPAPAVAVLERALDDEPGKRQPSAGRFVDELESALSKGGAPAAAAAGPATTRVATRARTAARPRNASGAVRRPRTASGADRGHSGRALAVGLLALGLLAVGGVALSGGGGDDPDSGGSGEQSAEAQSKTPAEEPAPAPEEPAADAQPEPAPGEGLDAAALNDLGFSLISEGRYEEAIPVLQRAVDSYEPGSTDLTYAYALFNLGHALRLAGRPEEAIPVLEQRLEIPNQTGAVRRELEAAIAATGEDSGDEGDDGDEGGPPYGKAKGHDKD
jgi:serine/threonine-protein kinase